MSIISKWFGGKPKEEVLSPHEAITKLKETAELLQKKSDFLENKINNEVLIAKQNASKNKRVALQALKRKKRFEKQLAQLDGTLSTLEFQMDALENASTQTEVLTSMKYAADALKQNQMDPDKVHDIMDDIAESKELTDEISETISSLGQSNMDMDEDELEAELQELEDEELEKTMISSPVVPLPDVPQGELPKHKVKHIEKDDELAELEAWAS